MVLHGEQLAGAGKAGLHFVGNQQDAVFVADLAQAFKQGGGHGVEAAFALHRLQDDGSHALGGHIGLEQHVDGG